ncbi:MAG: UDP-glucose 4-epimerase GalE [Polyangiaceae bacterium]
MERGSSGIDNRMRVLVTGGAGYIGSVVVEELLAAGAEKVVVLDDLSKGHRAAVTPPAVLVQGDIADGAAVRHLCTEHAIDVAVHLAAVSLVGESVQAPARYYEINLVKGLAFLDALLAAGVRRLVFSSTAAVYGEPAESPITEDFPTVPTNPYGDTKLAFERVLAWYGRAYQLRYASLRYFNAAGATTRNGEHHDPETHLIPLVLRAARQGNQPVLLFGDDYETPDGTCLRDYIHVSDLATAHVAAIAATREYPQRVYNLGCGGNGYSVLDVVAAARRVTGREIPVQRAPRRAGDPAVLVASSERIRRELSWAPSRQEMEVIVEDAWRWMLAHPDGYGCPP